MNNLVFSEAVYLQHKLIVYVVSTNRLPQWITLVDLTARAPEEGITIPGVLTIQIMIGQLTIDLTMIHTIIFHTGTHKVLGIQGVHHLYQV